MATEAANAERQARAQISVDTQVDRIAKVLNVAPPPRVRADTRDSRQAAEAERMAQFLQLVGDSIDPNAAAYKTQAAPQALGGLGDGYNELEEQAKREKAQGKGHSGEEGEAVAEEEPHFAGKPLSEFDAVPEDQLTEQDGVGPATAHDIVKARKARDRRANR